MWSNRYTAFAEVPGPHPLPTYCHNHSLHTAYRRYMLDTVLAFQRQQVELICAHSAAPISHNSEDSLDEWDVTRDLDVAGIDYYSHHATLEQMLYRLDCQRALKPGRRFWLLETNSEGELTDGPFPPGWLENVALLAYAAGAESISYWPWRTNRSGAEICGHDGVIHPCGVPTTVWEPARRTAVLRRQLESLLAEFSPAPAPVAMMRAERNGNAYYVERIAGLKPGFDLHAHLEAHHLAIVRLGAWRDVLYDQADVTGYKLVITPYLPYTTPEFLVRMRAHLAGGGTWVVGPYTGYLTEHHTNPLNGLLGDLGKMLDLDVVAWTPVKDLPLTLHDGSAGRAQMRRHAFAPVAGDEVLGVFGGDRIAGLGPVSEGRRGHGVRPRQ